MTSNEPNRRRSCSDSAIEIEWSFRQCPLPQWALPRPNHDVASCSSDDDHERIELGDRKGYRKARRKKPRVRLRRRAHTIGLDAHEIPRFCKELTEHVRSIKDGPLDAGGIDEDKGFFSALTAPYNPLPPPRGPKIGWTKHSSSSLTHESNGYDPGARRVGCPPGHCTWIGITK